MDLIQEFTTNGTSGVTLRPFDPDLHDPGSRSAQGGCAQGGIDTCHEQAVFSITGPNWRIAACVRHVYGALAIATNRLAVAA